MQKKGLFGDLYSRMLRRRFYNRLLFLNAAVFIVVVYIFCMFASFLLSRNEESACLQENREALAAVCDDYDRKHNNFFNVILPLYSSDSNSALSILMQGSDEQLNDAYNKQQIVCLLRLLTMQDGGIVAVLVHRKFDNSNYVYYEKNHFFGPTPQDFPYFSELTNKPPYGRAIYGVRTWMQAGQTQQTYGIAGTIGMNFVFNDAGSIMVAYGVSELHAIFQEYASVATGRSLIVSKEGDVIFDSAKELYGKRFERMDLLQNNGKTALYDGTKSVVQVIDHSNRDYYGINIVSSASINSKISGNRIIVFCIGTGISLISALLYMIAGIMSTRRVTELERAMDYIGSNHLDYRVPIRGREDEFEHIGIRFNRMCDELQDNVNKLYVNEIKQKNAELHALQIGINPHFLYNTLEVIRSKAHEDGNDDVADLIVVMASLLRNLVRSQTFIPIRQEINFCMMYLDMFALRYANIFEYSIEICQDVLDFGLPKGILQPLVENFFVHGIREDSDDNYLRMSGELLNGNIVLQIQDNGKGIEPHRLEELKAKLNSLNTSNTEYGITNVNDRIKLVFGADSGLSIESGGNGTTVHVTFRAMSCKELDESIKIHKRQEENGICRGDESLG